jgi:2-phosphoglycerate kinase
MDHVYWIGGGSGAGKSTIAQRIAAEHGLRYYSTDAAMADHAARSTPDSAPELHRFLAMDMDERWATRSPEVMLETFHWFRGEGFEHIVEDLAAGAEPVIAEGFRLLPELVAPLLAHSNQAVWLLPTPEFRRHAFDTRGSTWHLANTTSDPARALDNLLTRDHLFTTRLAEQTKALHLNAIQVDVGMTEDELCQATAGIFFRK